MTGVTMRYLIMIECICNNVTTKEIIEVLQKYEYINDVTDLRERMEISNKCCTCDRQINKVITDFRLWREADKPC